MSDVSILDPTLSIAAIKITRFEYTDKMLESPKSNDTKLNFGRFAVINPPTNHIQIGLKVELRYYEKQDEPETLALLEVRFAFEMKNLSELHEQENSQAIQKVIARLFDETYSITQGVWLTKIQGTTFQDHLMPLANTSQLGSPYGVEMEPWDIGRTARRVNL